MSSSSSSRSTPLAVGRKPGAREQVLDALAVAQRQPAERDRRPRRERHAEADGFAVQPALVAADRLERVAERVAEVQQRAPALLALVLGDDRGLDLAAAANRMRQRCRVEAPQVVDVLLEPGEERRVDDDAVLDDLGEAGGELARRQRCERAGIREHRDRLMERADHVLAARMVDGRLAADRGVDLREQRRRHLHEIDAALVARGDVARQVADDAAAERDEAAVAVETRRR